MSYAKRREKIYRPMREQGIFSWDFLYEQEYALATLGEILECDRQELAYATEGLGAIFTKTIAAVQHGNDALLRELGIPSQMFGAVRLPMIPDMPTLIGRFDFARTADGLKMLEFNADTPSGVVEAYYVNGEVCRFFGRKNPNDGCARDITEAFAKGIGAYKEIGYPVDQVVFSALEWHTEDAGTVEYLKKQSRLKACFTPLKDLRVYRDRLCALMEGELVPVDVWHRLHPFCILSEEKDADGYPTGAHVLDIIARKKLAVLNPPSALIGQTKALQALIWNLYETREFFSLAEREVISSYMLPTYLENRFEGVCSYVTKPILGREGGSISIYSADGTLLHQSSDQSYQKQIMVFQKFIEMETVTVETIKGQRRGFPVWGSFLIGGKASAINVRVGDYITDDLAYFFPMMYPENGENKGDKNGITMG